MDRRREMARRLGRVLLLAVVIAALVGVMEGNTTEGKDDVEVKIGSGKTFGEKVLPWATIGWGVVTGGIMIWLGWQQKKMLKRQTEWEEKFGESQLRQERELTERQLKQERELTERAEWVTVGEKRHAAVKAAWEFLIEGVFAEKVRGSDKARFFAEVGLRGGLFGEKEEKDLKGLGDKVGELNELQGQLREERGKVRAGAGSAGEVKKLERKRQELLDRVTEVLYRLGNACWERRGS